MGVGKLQQVSTSVSDGTATELIVTGIDSDNVYMLVYQLLSTENNNEGIQIRVTKGGSEDTTTNYDQVHVYNSSTSPSSGYQTNANKLTLIDNVDDDTQGGGQGFAYLYNFNSSSQFSYWSYECVADVSNQKAGLVGSSCHTVASASDGVKVFGLNGGTFKSGGRVTLYKIV